MFKLKTYVPMALPLFLLVGSANASVLDLSSGAGETINNTGNPTVNIIHDNPIWGPAFGTSKWVSYVESGDPSQPGYVQVPDEKFVLFSDFFTSVAGATGSVAVMADDVTNVILNGVTLKSFPDETEGTCSTLPIGCTLATAGHINLTGIKTGLNILQFEVEEDSGQPFGLDYSAEVSSGTRAVTPEPLTSLLMSLPLLAFGLLRRKFFSHA